MDVDALDTDDAFRSKAPVCGPELENVVEPPVPVPVTDQVQGFDVTVRHHLFNGLFPVSQGLRASGAVSTEVVCHWVDTVVAERNAIPSFDRLDFQEPCRRPPVGILLVDGPDVIPDLQHGPCCDAEADNEQHGQCLRPGRRERRRTTSHRYDVER